MKLKQGKKLMAILFTFCMILSFMPISVSAAEGDTNITEVNINGVSNELWSYKDVQFATVDESSNYTIENQEWYSSETDKITPTGESLKPTTGAKYTFNITLKANDGCVFPIKSQSGVFYDGVFKVNGNEFDDAAVTVTSDKTIKAVLFVDTKVKGVADGGSNVEIKTKVRMNYTDCQVTDDINLKKSSDYIIDFTKEDNLSMALRAMADLEKTKYYKFANSDNNSLIETEDASEALIKIVGNKSENKAIMSLINDADTNTSYSLNFMRTQYTGDKLTYNGTDYKENGKVIIEETRDEYYTRYHFNCKLNLIAYSSTPDPIPSSNYKIIEGTNSSWVQNADQTLTFRINGDLSKFVGIKIDDKSIDSEHYTVASGSTVVTLKNEYLKTLSEGEHKITFVYTDGEVSTNFEIKELGETYENSDNPKTGDNSNILVWCSVFAISALAMFGMIVYNRKKKSMA